MSRFIYFRHVNKSCHFSSLSFDLGFLQNYFQNSEILTSSVYTICLNGCNMEYVHVMLPAFTVLEKQPYYSFHVCFFIRF